MLFILVPFKQQPPPKIIHFKQYYMGFMLFPD